MKIAIIFHVFVFVVYKWLKKLRRNVYFSNTFWLYQLRVSSAQFLSNSSLNLEILILDTLYNILTELITEYIHVNKIKFSTSNDRFSSEMFCGGTILV